jgi:predicted nucleic acid-binding protein
MTDRVFVDTNVLVYSRDISQGEKQQIAARWMETLWEHRNG